MLHHPASLLVVAKSRVSCFKREVMSGCSALAENTVHWTFITDEFVIKHLEIFNFRVNDFKSCELCVIAPLF